MSQLVFGVAHERTTLGLPDQSDARWLAVVSGIRTSYLEPYVHSLALTEEFEKMLLVSEETCLRNTARSDCRDMSRTV